MTEQEEDYSLLPLPDRFQHKAWKVRKAAYEDAMKRFELTPDEFDPIFQPFNQDPSLWKGAVADSNVAAQQSGIAALCAFLKYGSKENCIRSRNFTINSLVEKGLASTKANTKASSLEAILLYIELDTAAPIIEELLPPLSNKQPKVVAATLAALTLIYHNYGCKVVDPKPALKSLPKVFTHADKNVRAEATNLAVELYRWLREAMKPIFWGDLKSTQQADMESQFERIKTEPAPKQERLLRSQQATIAEAPTSHSGSVEAENDENDQAEIDVFSMLEPQDVLTKIAPNFVEQVSSPKWKDRKDALESVYAILSIPKIKDGDFSDLVRMLAKCMKDPNITVVMQAAQCIEALAKGLRNSFGKYRSIVCSPIMERMKEKKTTVSDALGAALDQVFFATNLSDNLEETLEFLKHKNPQIKEGTMKFLIRCLKTTKDVPSKPEVGSISESAKKLLTESSEVLRSGGAEVLGTLMKILGERAMGPHLEGLDDIRKIKIREYFEIAVVKAKEKPKQVQANVPNRVAPANMARKNTTKKSVVKKSAPTTQSVYSQESNSAPSMATRTNTKSKLSGSKTSNIAAPGLKPPTKRTLGGPPSVATPRRANIQVPTFEEDSNPPQRTGLTRGLAGRSLVAKAPMPSSVSSNSLLSSNFPGLATSERIELEELRRDKEKLVKQNEELRLERTRLNSEVQELKNETAKLIEDRAKDSLSVISKETQLVRYRSDYEAAEAMCGQLRREMERLKRALASAERVNSSAKLSPTSDNMNEDIATHRSSLTFGNFSDNRQLLNKSRLSYTSTLSDEKEIGENMTNSFRNKFSSDIGRNGRSSVISGRNSPATHPSFQQSRNTRNTSAHSIQIDTGHELESWKRAAEVTSALKAKIEQMKARQGISRS